MKSLTSHIPVIRTILLFLFVLLSIPSCKIFHFDKLNPYNDFTTDQLSNYEISKIRIIIPDSVVISPGQSFSIGVIAETHFRKEIKTRGLCNGFV
ncbi:MAG TPA: hypothetical protein VFJ43_12685, partial [Bacteroidia bacterium]|nr:hypothetical protein [Bacteroidia bacterium]